MPRHEQKYAVQYHKVHSNGADRTAYYLTYAINETAAIANCKAAHPTAVITHAEQFQMPIWLARQFYHGYKVPQTAK